MKKKLSKSASVIIASYNRKDMLSKNLEALDSQKFKGGLEIIVVDDGSSDGTPEMLKDKAASSKFIFKYFKTSHLGPANARNLGVANSQGEVLIFLDDDCVVQKEDYVQKMVENFEEAGVGIAAGRTIDFYSGMLNLIRAGDPPELDFDNPSGLKKAVGVPTKNAAFLKEAICKAGGFNPIFKYAFGEDLDLCIRIFDLGYKLAFNKEALVYHYPANTFKGYIRKSYYNGFSHGIFYSLHPDKSPKLSLLKAVISPLSAVKTFYKKTKICFSQKLFSQAAFKEIILMFFWIVLSYGAIYWGEINYLIKRSFISTKIRLKAINDLNKYYFEMTKYFIKTNFLPQRRTFIFYLTNKCNQRCSHCFFSQDINKDIAEPSLEEIKEIAKNYYYYTNTKKIFARNICQGFTGGEPFLRDDLSEIILVFRKVGVRHFQINTNGMLTDKIVDLCRKLLKQNASFQIIISIDGLEQTHDKIRNTPGAFQKAIQTIKKLKDIGVNVGAIITINRLNYKEIGETVKFLNKLGLEPGLQLIRGVSQSSAPFELRDNADPLDKNFLITKEIIPEIRDNLYKIYLEKLIENPLKMTEFARTFTHLEAHLDILESRKRFFNCLAGRSVGVIYQNGDVALCEFYKPIGNLKEANFDLPLLWNNAEAEKQRAFIKKCFCHHDCFINIEYNFRFAGHLTVNLDKFSGAALKNFNFN